MNVKCRICQRKDLYDTPADHATMMCEDCRKELGVFAMPPPRRGPVPCARCNGLRFIRAIPREYGARSAYSIWHEHPDVVAKNAPMTVTQLFGLRGCYGGNTVSHPEMEDGRGLLEMYICAGCGFIEWYCHDPQSIPIGPEYMTQLVDYDPSQGPFR